MESSFLQDFKQTKEINEFSKESQDLIADMNSTEIFELCENFSKQLCLECDSHWEIRNNQLQLLKKYEVYAESNRVRQEQPCRHHNPLVQKFVVCHRLERTPHNATRPNCVEKHIYTATRAERIQNSKHWILTINAEGGTQQSLNQRPERKENANDCMTSTWQGPKKNTEGNEEYYYAVDSKTGWWFYRHSLGNLQTSSSGSRAKLQETSSSSSTWDQTHWKTSNWKSQHSSSPDDW